MNVKVKNALLSITIILLIALLLASCFMYHKYNNIQKEVVIWNDSTKYYKNKYNEEYLSKNTYILQVSQLKSYNDSLYKEYCSLKEHPIIITKTKIVTKIDTIFTTVDSLWTDSLNTTWIWSCADSCWYNISGTCKVKKENGEFKVSTNIDKLVMTNGITLDVVDNGNQLIVLAKSDNPYTEIENIQSVVIDPTTSPTLKKYFKPKRWGFGPYIGVGIYTGYGLMPNTGYKPGLQIGIGASIGFSVHYDLIQW
ncbi:MAG: hypothetical protein [Wendovervirus sonii]|uniref:Uncharacterized protein n=1 Tax=phage Lak_Megaphage_Sonny TaxID=3109229 RepID=A0ABZ0Z6P7_9CAUD|nr:MAG: hypothetical protein [phage Lak_Megaphage_Sonny]